MIGDNIVSKSNQAIPECILRSEPLAYLENRFMGVKMGCGYTMLPGKVLFGECSSILMNNDVISVYVTLASHANRNGDCEIRPSKSRISTLSGVSIEKTENIYDILMNVGLLKMSDDHMNVAIAKEPYETGDFSIFTTLVFRGIWSVLPFSSKKLYLYYCKISEPYASIYECCGNDFCFKTFAEMSRSVEGRRMIDPSRIDLKNLRKILDISERTFSHAKKILNIVGLISRDQYEDVLIVHNCPGVVYPDVILRVIHSNRNKKYMKGSLKSIRSCKPI